MSKPKMTGASDAEVIALLKRYQCPTPFHEVWTRFLRNIASPVIFVEGLFGAEEHIC